MRCLDEFLSATRWNKAIYGYRNEGDGIQPLPADEKEIKKLRSGIYADKKLRLIVDPAGNRKWVFRFIWRRTVTDLMLGGSEVSLATARKRATEASRMLAAGQNPIDGSWSSSALRSLRSKLDFGINRREQLGGIVGLIANHLQPPRGWSCRNQYIRPEQVTFPLAYQVAHFCKAIGLGKTKFYELVAAGKIRTVLIGGRRLIPILTMIDRRSPNRGERWT